MSKNWNQPICEMCWIERNSEWEEHPDGFDVLVSIRQPVTVKNSGIETCCYCGDPTVVGIYIRKDPDEVNYPKEAS